MQAKSIENAAISNYRTLYVLPLDLYKGIFNEEAVQLPPSSPHPNYERIGNTRTLQHLSTGCNIIIICQR